MIQCAAALLVVEGVCKAELEADKNEHNFVLEVHNVQPDELWLEVQTETCRDQHAAAPLAVAVDAELTGAVGVPMAVGADAELTVTVDVAPIVAGVVGSALAVAVDETSETLDPGWRLQELKTVLKGEEHLLVSSVICILDLIKL